MSLHDASLQQLLADLARGNRSQHVDVLREASEEQGVPLDEIARRAQFMLACLLLPASGTFYEVLDVAHDASAAEIRERWTAAIRRYHPDHFGGQNPWLDAQARRLIEAYETLRDPGRRRQYDADLARHGPRLHPPMVPGAEATGRARWRHLGWRLGILLLVVVVLGIWARMRLAPGVDPLPPAPVPPSPRLLETWRSRFLAPPPAETAPGRTPLRDASSDTGATPSRPAVRAGAPQGELRANRTVPERSVGPADSDRARRAERPPAPESVRVLSDGSQSQAEPAVPATAGGSIETSRSDR